MSEAIVEFNVKDLENIGKAIHKRLRANMKLFGNILLVNVAKNKSSGGYMPVDTGHLIQSVKIIVNKEELWIEVWTDVEYAPYVEDGTRYQAAQRPFEIGTGLARKEILKVIDIIVEEEIDKALEAL